MKRQFIYLFLLTFIFSCSSPTELPLFDSVKPADKFSRAFIDKIIGGQLESCFADIDPKNLDNKAKEFITNASNNVKGARIKKYRIVEENVTSGFTTSSGQFSNYRLAYEYEFQSGKNILFLTSLTQRGGKFYVTDFNGQVLEAPLSELTKFNFTNKPVVSYIFLLFSILVPVFILTTLIVMLRSTIKRKKKIIWAFIILFISFPTFITNWDTGEIDFKILNFVLLGTGFGKSAIYLPWLVSFGIPIGGLLFWLKRDNLLREFEQESEEYTQ